MDNSIQSRLNEGETILWQSRTESIQALDQTNKKRFVVNTIVCSLTFIILTALYLSAVKGEPKPGLIVLLVVLCAFAPVRRLLDAKAVQKLQYVITDQRLLVLSSEVKSVELARIQEAALRTDEDGHLSLLVGSRAVKAKPSHWREVAVTGQPSSLEDGLPIETFAFYAVADKAGLKETIKRVLPFVTE